jgi:hypothetical protein
MHSEKAWATTVCHVEMGLFEVTGLCTFQLNLVLCLDSFIYSSGNSSLALKIFG